MRLAPMVLCSLFFVQSLLATDTAQKFSVHFRNLPAAAAVDSISKISGRPIHFDVRLFPPEWRVTLRAYGTVTELLHQLLAGKPYQVEEAGHDIYISLQPKKLFSLLVLNQRGERLADVTLHDADSNRRWKTNADGRWQAWLYHDTLRLRLSMVNHRADSITLPGTVVATLEESIDLQEEVECGYGKTNTRRSPGVAVVIRPEQIGQPYFTIADVLRLATGVLVNSKTDVRWGNSTIEIRGSRTIQPLSPGRRIDEPLVLIDNVPCLACTGPQSQLTSVVDPLGTGPGLHQLTFLNVDDVESITVLKDGLATAIYGARGANGVILINLRKTKGQRLRINAYLASSVVSAYRVPQTLHTTDYLLLRLEAIDGRIAINKGNTPDLFLDSTRYTNWPRKLYNNPAINHTAQLSASGGTETFSWLGSLNFRKEQYVYPTTVMDEWARFYTQLRYEPVSRSFSITALAAASLGSNASPAADLSPIAYALPHASGTVKDDSLSRSDDPLRLLKSRYHAATTYYLSHVQLNLPIGHLLEARVNVGLGYQGLREKAGYFSGFFTGDSPVAPQLVQAARQVRTWITEPQLHLQAHPGHLQLRAVLGVSYQQSRYRSDLLPNQPVADDAALHRQLVYPKPDTSWTQYKLLSTFARVHLAWKKQWQWEGSGRMDASSRFYGRQRPGWFYAVGGAWIPSDAPWWPKRLSKVSFARVRFSHGLTGSDQVADYAYMGQWSPSNAPYSYGAYPGWQASLPGNKLLTWAKTRKTEAGLSLEWRNRLLIDAGYYFHRSYHQVITAPLPAQSGFTIINYWNYGALVDNRGWDLSLQYKNDTSRRWKVRVGVNYTIPTNRLTTFPQLGRLSLAGNLIEGRPLSARKVYQATGIDSNGLYTVADLNGDGQVSEADKLAERDLEIKGYGTLQVQVVRGPWAFTLLVEGRRQPGYTAAHYTNRRLPPGMGDAAGFNNQPLSVLQRWPLQSPALYQRASALLSDAAQTAFNRQQASTASFTDQSYVCVRNLGLQYTVASKRLHRAGIQQLRLFVQGQNLLVWSPYRDGNPLLQEPFSQPVTRVYTFGVQVAFKQ
ncbi:TonB-dependent receptor plug domain-containing protein [Paraflavitalea sp. CAU 1676]|uniref:TonB-dependent receptor plug domain-containing protein n=1 Tax=Paraflavitalea sp. CAU 1676 TaxID=3032598 RepID=UPI0023DC650B|nr:TonB-dependent receptor plug domain-containing protein [Paraflavitalea sp. CAU 1676]MDF2192623.1 TonB-dependent receptor plug domain-containing protein [Paraflavitalea sp. CAU 1676]